MFVVRLLGTHQGSVDESHLPNYLDEFVFRFNRRCSRSRGMVPYRILQLAVDHDPIRYRQLVATSEPKAIRPHPPADSSRPAAKRATTASTTTLAHPFWNHTVHNGQ
jgi:hypothetical protein